MQIDMIDAKKTALIVVDMKTTSWPRGPRWKRLRPVPWFPSLPKR